MTAIAQILHYELPDVSPHTMRIVAVADTHLFHEDFHLGIPDGDVFVHAGDMCQFGTMEELAMAADWVNSLSFRHKVIISGNHDWGFKKYPNSARAMFKNIHYLRDSGCTINGVRFYGAPWQPEFCNWAWNLPRGPELAAKWALIPDRLDVLVTHGPPRGYGDRVGVRGPQGCDDLLERLRVARPRLHLFGHIHEDGGLWKAPWGTVIANVTTAEGRRGATVIDLDLRTRSIVGAVVPPTRRRS